MQTYYSTAEFYIPYPTIVTIGMFDGVHLGHRKIIQDLVTRAQELDLESVVLTFGPHPREVLSGISIQCLTTIEEKIALMEQLGVDHLIIQDFTSAFAHMSAQDYMQTILVDQLHADIVMIGHDHRFGHDRGAGIEELAEFGYQHGFSVIQIPVCEIDKVAISSTVIREALLSGQIIYANQYLGYNYQLTGVAHLEHKFKDSFTVSFVIVDSHKLIPADGEYIIRVGEYDRKLVISHDGLELYLIESKQQGVPERGDAVIFGEQMQIVFYG